MKRFTLLMVLLVVSLVCLASSVFAEDTVLKFSTWLATEGASKETIETMVGKFEKANPGVKVELINIPFNQTQQQTIIAVAGGNAPDIIQLVPQWLPPLSEMGALEDLSAYYAQEELTDIPKAALESGSFDDKVIAVPWQLGTILVLGWKDLMAQAGYDAIPETWEELTVAVEKVSALGDDIYGFGGRTSNAANDGFWFFPVLWGFGGKVQDAEGNVVLNSPETLAAVNWYKALGAGKQTPVGVSAQESRSLFAKGKVGFIFDGPWMKGILRAASGEGEAVDDKYMVAPFPKAKDGNRYGIGNNHVLAVSKQGKNKDLAVKFIKFFTQDEEMTKFYYEKMGAVPTYKKLLADPLYDSDPFAQAIIQAAEFANCVPVKHPKISTIFEEIAIAAQQGVLGKDTVKAVETAEKKVKALLGK